MPSCFTHPDRESETQCPYCAKTFCDDCLLLHGSLDRIACTNCFDSIAGRLRSSISRRWVYAALGLLLGPYLFYLGYVQGSDTTMALVGIGCIIASAVNLVRIKTYRDTLQSRPYAPAPSPSSAAGG